MAEEVYRSTLAQALFYVDGKPLSLVDYPMFEAIYDGKYSRLLLKTGRQVTKSTTLASFMIAEAIATAPFKSYYISPTQEQTRKFSHTRVAKILAYSPDVRKALVGPESIDNVYLRMLKNQSEMAFTYAVDDPDRARGYSADRTLFDEVQDIVFEAVIPVIEECFDARTEVLTKRGWVCVTQLALSDEIADVDENHRIEWHRPSRLLTRQHSGQMVTFKHDFMSMRVTDTHQMWVHPNGETRALRRGKWQFMSATDIVHAKGEAYRFAGPSGLRTSSAPLRRTFPGIVGAHGQNARGLDLPYDALARLVGWYIAEGSIKWAKRKGVLTCPRPVITQSEGRYLQDILDTLDQCGLTYSISSNSKNPHVKHVTVNSRILGEYLSPLGKAFDKYIPDEFFVSEMLLRQVLEGMYLGDAAARVGMSWDKWTYSTVSARLADDVHRAWTLCGRSATKRAKPYNDSMDVIYEVCAYTDNFFIFYRRNNNVTVEHVTDETVYCFTVPNHRPVMRGGPGQRPIITGQCMANSRYQYSAYCGTPKTMENTIEVLWSLSSQTEWCMRCDGCSKWTFVAGTKAIGKKGLICVGCGHLLNPRNGQWIDMATGQGVKGFHISQAIMPTNVPAAWQPGTEGYDAAVDRWEKLLYKMESPLYGETKFLNECIGVSTSTGVRLLTKEILEALCDDKFTLTRLPTSTSHQGIVRTVAGVDWSGGGGEVKGSEGLYKSRTVLHIWGQQADGRLRTLTSKIFPNGHATGWIDEIVELCEAWGVQMVGCDAGEGALANSFLRQRLGEQRVIPFRYMALSKPLEWNPPTMTYHVDRTTMIDTYARMLLHKQVVYPCLRDAQPAISDILNVYEEVTHQGRRVWRHAPTMPDDSLHAQVFGWLAWGVLSGNLKFS